MSVKSLLVGENLSYAVAGRVLLDGVTISLGKEKTGLVGDNGTGKTTLAKILVGQLKPAAGKVYRNGKIGYLPQDFKLLDEQTVASVLGIDEKIESIQHVDAGSGQERDFETIGDDWNIAERTKILLDSVGLGNLSFDRKIKTLSGGQTTRIVFTSLLLQNPGFIILDEPTNNLDAASRQALCRAITNFDGGVLVISHDRELLGLMDQIVELSSLGVKTYGGSYDAYASQKEVEQEALQRHVDEAKDSLRKTKKTVQKSKEKFDQKTSRGKKQRRSGCELKMFYDAQKTRSEKTKSKQVGVADKLVHGAREKLAAARQGVEDKKYLDFKLEATKVHKTKLVLKIKNLEFSYPGIPKPIFDGFNLTLVGPQRISISGPNGSGKTTLLKLITGEISPGSGTIKLGVDRCAYLDQNVEILDPNLTVLENFERMNPDVGATDCRLRLAAFLFDHENALKVVKNLSGGEKLRAGLACVLMSDAPPQLVVLDEPTNNMDLSSIKSIENALQCYQGALIVVSHDEVFLKKIDVSESSYHSIPNISNS
jgi:ATPase subunit of ABC transporter with duplicated ATPase domains